MQKFIRHERESRLCPNGGVEIKEFCNGEMTKSKGASTARWKVRRIHVSDLEEYLNDLSRRGWEILYPFNQENGELGLEYVVIAKNTNDNAGILEVGGDELNVKTLADLEAEAISIALQKNKGNKTKTAALLGIMKMTLYRKIVKYGIEEIDK